MESQIKKLMFDNFLSPLQENLKDVIENKEKHDQKHAEEQTKLKELEEKNVILQKQIAMVIF